MAKNYTNTSLVRKMTPEEIREFAVVQGNSANFSLTRRMRARERNLLGDEVHVALVQNISSRMKRLFSSEPASEPYKKLQWYARLERVLPIALIIGIGLSTVFWIRLVILLNLRVPGPDSQIIAVAAILSTLCTTLGWWFRVRAKPSPDVDVIITQHIPPSILKWNERVFMARSIIRRYAQNHRNQDMIIKFAGEVLSYAGAGPVADYAAHGVAISTKIPLYQSLSQEIASVFLSPPNAIGSTYAPSLSLGEELIDITVNDIGGELLISTLSDGFSQMLLYVPILKTVVSGALAYVYTWAVGVATVAYILNGRRLIENDKAVTIQYAKNVLNINTFRWGPFRFPKNFQEPNLDDLFEYDEIKVYNSNLIAPMVKELRTHYPTLNKDNIRNLLFSHGIPPLLIESVLARENWRGYSSSTPTLFQLLKNEIIKFRDQLVDS